jgi:hypothetical protein
VTELPDLLELLAGADTSFRTVRLTVRRRRDRARASEAFDRHTEERQRERIGTAALLLVGDEAEPEPEPLDETARIWLEQPDRFRYEVQGRSRWTIVSDGRTTWHHSEYLGTMREDSGARPRMYVSALLEPAALIPGLDFDVREWATFAGRDALRVRARPRAIDPTVTWHPSHGLAPGADGYDLVVDADRGVLLRTAALIDGHEFAVSEVTEIAFDERLDPGIFTYVPREGEVVRTAEEARAWMALLPSVEEAARRAPFTVFVPVGLGPGWTVDVVFHEAREQSPVPASVSVNYTPLDHVGEQFQLSQRAAPEAQTRWGPDWERVDRDGARVLRVHAVGTAAELAEHDPLRPRRHPHRADLAGSRAGASAGDRGSAGAGADRAAARGLMGELGEALALMHGAGDRFSTLRATVRRSYRGRESVSRVRIRRGKPTDVRTGLELMLHPAPLLGALRFELLGPSSVAGRGVIRLRALPRAHEGQSLTLLRLGHEADAYDLAVDAERGVILRQAALSEGLEYQVTEMLEVVFDG